MKSKKSKLLLRICAALLALGMLAGCAGDTPSSRSSSSQESSENASSAERQASAEESGESSESSEPAGTSVTLPLTEEKVTLTLWTPMDSNSINVIDNMGESEFFQQLEERTNVHIDFQHPATGNEASAYNLMIAGGELPDMIKNAGGYIYPDGLDAAVEDGYYMDLTDLIPQYAPNYLKAIDNYASYEPLFKQATVTNKGRMVGISGIMTEPQGPYAGLYVRKDWLDDCGLETPVTYGDWETMLKAFKDQKGATAPLLLSNTGYDPVGNTLSCGFGVP